VPPGVRFVLSLVLDNPEDHEIGLGVAHILMYEP
jgi:hypothetical protein